jgi:drug/metabolite transporter (DMT)-like permease
MIEHILRVLILLPLLPRFLKEYKKMTRRDWLLISAIAVFSGALGTIFYTAALAKVNFISYSVVVLLQQIRPLFAVILAALVLKERLTKRYIFLGIIALTSAYFLTFPHYKPTLLGSKGELVAAALALGAATMWGSTIVLSKIILQKLSYAAAVTLRFIIVIPTAFIFSLILGQTYPLIAITSTQWLHLFLLAVVTGVFGFIAYYKGLQYTEVKVATFSEYAWPVSAALIGYFILGDRLTVVQVIAATVLIADVLFLSLAPREKSS